MCGEVIYISCHKQYAREITIVLLEMEKRIQNALIWNILKLKTRLNNPICQVLFRIGFSISHIKPDK